VAIFVQTVDFTVEVPDENLPEDEDGSGFTMEIPMELLRVDDTNRGEAVKGARVTGYATTNVERLEEFVEVE
jgi:hypothetical protein